MSARSLVAVLVGFGGVALLVQPEGEATIVGLLACICAALIWAVGSFASPRMSLPRDPLVSTAWQTLLGGLVIVSVGLVGGEAGDVDFDAFSGRSIFGFALPDRLRVAARLHVLRLAAAERADLEGLDLRLREPGRRDRPRLADPRRDDHADHAGRRRDHRRLGRTRHPGRSARNATCGNPARSIGPISSKPRRRMTAWDGRLVVIVQARISVRPAAKPSSIAARAASVA